MKNLNSIEEDSGKQPCVVFDEIDVLLATEEDLHHYVDENGVEVFKRRWEILNFNPESFKLTEGYAIIFDTIIYCQNQSDMGCDHSTVRFLDDQNRNWLGRARLLTNDHHINADTKNCNLKFNAVLAVMRKAIQIDLDFVVELHDDCKKKSYH